jgi:hypothetical protein
MLHQGLVLLQYRPKLTRSAALQHRQGGMHSCTHIHHRGHMVHNWQRSGMLIGPTTLTTAASQGTLLT